ncbi:MAG: DUF1905 domain-containing protein [Patescibacteria group bacterium]
MKFTFKGKIWLYQGAGPWHFVTIDEKTSQKIKESQKGKKRVGWGSIRVTASLGKTSWNTSIFPNKDGTYILPLKLEVRQKEAVAHGDMVKISCSF